MVKEMHSASKSCRAKLAQDSVRHNHKSVRDSGTAEMKLRAGEARGSDEQQGRGTLLALSQKITGMLGAATLSLLILVTHPLTTAYAEDDNLINPQQLPDSSFMYDTSIGDLSAADAYFDGQTVQVTGEAIGDNLIADAEGKYRWITLIAQDTGTNATITVYMSADEASLVDTFGKYGATGTMLKVRGTYHLTCSDHEGLSDIHAEAVTVVQKGKVSPDEFDIMEFVPGAVVVVVGLGLLLAYYHIRERRR